MGSQALNDTEQYRRTMLRTVGIGKRFGSLVALDDISFDIPRHSIVSVIGPNGAGKTVFFNILTGLLKPDTGTVWFNGKDITGLAPDRISALGISRTFQNIRLFANMTVLENVLVGRHAHLQAGIWGTVFRTRAMVDEEARATHDALEVLEFAGLGGMAQQTAKNLPYGAGRRLEIARALATNPQLLLLDEPTAGMNPQETAEMIDMVQRLQRETGLTILLIEHDMKVVMRISDRITVLDSGVKIAEGKPEEVRAEARVIEAYLGRGAAYGEARSF